MQREDTEDGLIESPYGHDGLIVIAEIPVDALWLTAAQVGAQLGYSAQVVLERVAKQPDFPAPSRVGESGHPRWNAAEINHYMRRRQQAERERVKDLHAPAKRKR